MSEALKLKLSAENFWNTVKRREIYLDDGGVSGV